MKTIHSWLALLIGILAIIIEGILNHYLSGFPGEAAIGTTGLVVVGYFTKRIAQRHRSFRDYEDFPGE